MSYFEEDFYHEPSEFEMQIEEFKASLMSKVKEDYIKELERLKKENAELQNVKKNFEGIKNGYEKKKRELEYERSNLLHQVRRERLSELMKDCEIELFTVGSKGRRQPKCDKCNEDRRIPYTTPLGKETYEICDCDSKIQVYEPIPIMLHTFSIRNGNGLAWYKIHNDRHDEWFTYYDDSISGKDLITDESQFESIGYSYKTLFKTKELAQQYSDYKNSQVNKVSKSPRKK
jgi:hypothetical protein